MNTGVKITRKSGKVEYYETLKAAKQMYDYRAERVIDKRISDWTEEDSEDLEIINEINNMIQQQERLTLREQHCRVW